MYKSGRWPIALPTYDDADAAGAGAPVADVADAEGSLSDHEAAFVQGAPSEPTDDDPPAASATERDETGRYKPRHRAASQRADADDVPAINELTKRLKAAEETHGKDIVRKDGESDRVFTLRRRAELLERQTPAPVAAAPVRAAEPTPRTAEPTPNPAAAPPAKFPEFDVWLADPANKDKDYNDYTDARWDHRHEQRRATEREQEAVATADREARDFQQAYADKIPAARTQFPDFDAALATVDPNFVSIAVERAAKAIGPEAVYYLATHPDVLKDLFHDTLVLPHEPGFATTVAATKRYLSTLVAPQRSPSTRTAAGTTGAARATSPPIAPKPPTLVRTGASRDADELPGDDSSLAEHERAFVKVRRA